MNTIEYIMIIIGFFAVLGILVYLTSDHNTISDKVKTIESYDDLAADDYQILAARTINNRLSVFDTEKHALHGMVGEIGELHSLYQKVFQGHEMDEEHLMKECGDLLWFVAEYCTAKGWAMSEVMHMNVQKLINRYPEGFSDVRSLNREEGDI